MHVDRDLAFHDKQIHECVSFVLRSLLQAQYPNGAWPQRFAEFPDPAKFPVKPASYPDQWSRTYPAKDYRGFYTFNDNSIADVVSTMFEAAALYDEPAYRQAALRAGEFIIRAQMPEPQPGWAQQYDAGMHPPWARRFEPPAITGGESRGVIQTLMQIYRETGDKKFLEPVPRALAYYKDCELPGGRMARFYELKTNRPLYFTKKYELTYRDDDLPTHYGFIQSSSWVDRLAEEYRRLVQLNPQRLKPQWQTTIPAVRSVRLTPPLAAAAQAAIDQLDGRGAWVEAGQLRSHKQPARILTTQTFVANIETLGRFLSAAK